MFEPGMEKSDDQPGVLNHSYMKDVVTNEKRIPMVVQLKTNKKQNLHTKESSAKHATNSEIVKGTKLVIHLGSRNRNVTASPKPEAPSYKEHDLAAPNGTEDVGQQISYDNEVYMHVANDRPTDIDNGKGIKYDNANRSKRAKHGHGDGGLKKQGVSKLGVLETETISSGGNVVGEPERPESNSNTTNPFISGKHSAEKSAAVEVSTATTIKREVPLKKYSRNSSSSSRSENHVSIQSPPASDALSKDPKPLLKLKFKSPYFENQSSWVSWGEEERSSIKGQRSKRKRPSPSVRENKTDAHSHHKNPKNEVMEANWILQKLGKDAIGKRVEVHQSSDNTWHKGLVSDVIDGTSSLSVRLEDGRFKTVELEKQGVRFVPQKQKRTKLIS
ncbi:hypothetical protein QJS10_CPB22g01339 [Acorus calamus]|uniref:Uncharacterized protein n=1 Tax=Acorus calamus TaxID=4465 RepID=A0AAV9C2A5_ACOCL|nr:hypothetical protein QJS10_CPB22g01339 [Acorus calamus]